MKLDSDFTESSGRSSKGSSSKAMDFTAKITMEDQTETVNLRDIFSDLPTIGNFDPANLHIEQFEVLMNRNSGSATKKDGSPGTKTKGTMLSVDGKDIATKQHH